MLILEHLLIFFFFLFFWCNSAKGIPEVPSSSPAFQVPLGAHNNSAKGKHINSSVAGMQIHTNIELVLINSVLSLHYKQVLQFLISFSNTTTLFGMSASPMVQVTPRPVIMGLGLGRSAGRKLKPERLLVLLMTLAATFLTKATHSV